MGRRGEVGKGATPRMAPSFFCSRESRMNRKVDSADSMVDEIHTNNLSNLKEFLGQYLARNRPHRYTYEVWILKVIRQL